MIVSGNKMKIFIETYGCQMNVADSELVASILKDRKFDLVNDIDNADIIIFNTCSVRQHAEDRVIGGYRWRFKEDDIDSLPPLDDK